jgi:hypothetical protein
MTPVAFFTTRFGRRKNLLIRCLMPNLHVCNVDDEREGGNGALSKTKLAIFYTNSKRKGECVAKHE